MLPFRIFNGYNKKRTCNNCRNYFNTTKSITKRETISALRPFYLLVHPDFFTQHPTKRDINETSLQKLNSYLEALHCSKQRNFIQPTKVEFYIKKNAESSSIKGFNFVQFTLNSKDIETNIHTILAAFNLPTAKLDESTKHGSTRSTNPQMASDGNTEVVFDEDFRQTNKAKNYTEHSHIRSLKRWLSLNITQIRREQELCEFVRQSNNRLKETLCMRYGMKEIQWLSTWEYTGEQGVLKILSRTWNQHPDFLHSLQGRRLVFTDRSYAAADESICLNVEDVPQHLMEFISSFDKSFMHIYKETSQLETYIQQRLGNILIKRPKVNRKHPSQYQLQTLSSYIKVIRSLAHAISKISDSDINIDKWVFRNNTLRLIVGDTNALSEKGEFLTPYDCNVLALIKFMKENQTKASEQKYVNAVNKTQILKYKQLCKKEYRIENISKNWNVSEEQMLSCCERLYHVIPKMPYDLSGLRINVSANQFAVFLQGSLSIPWNWED